MLGMIEPCGVITLEGLCQEVCGEAWPTPQVYGQARLLDRHLAEKSPAGLRKYLSEDAEPLGRDIGVAKQIGHAHTLCA